MSSTNRRSGHDYPQKTDQHYIPQRNSHQRGDNHQGPHSETQNHGNKGTSHCSDTGTRWPANPPLAFVSIHDTGKHKSCCQQQCCVFRQDEMEISKTIKATELQKDSPEGFVGLPAKGPMSFKNNLNPKTLETLPHPNYASEAVRTTFAGKHRYGFNPCLDHRQNRCTRCREGSRIGHSQSNASPAMK